jgi:hypothetical protein
MHTMIVRERKGGSGEERVRKGKSKKWFRV